MNAIAPLEISKAVIDPKYIKNESKTYMEALWGPMGTLAAIPLGRPTGTLMKWFRC